MNYGESDVMAFIISQSGRIYEKDPGPATAKLAAAMTEYNPDSKWKQVER